MILALLGCVVPHPPLAPMVLPSPADPTVLDWDAPGPIVAEISVSARWEVPLSGIVDLEDPRAADLVDGPAPIVLPVVRLRHPTFGTVVIDSGVDRDIAAGGRGPVRAPVSWMVGGLEPVASLAELVEGEPLAALVLTHVHADHVLGLPDWPSDLPVVVGPGELDGRSFANAALAPTLGAALAGASLRALDPEDAVPLGFSDAVGWDLIGDGSLWAVASPGHTVGSLALIVRTVDGPLVVTGDTSHTRWGWDHDVAPGTYTEDPVEGRRSLERLRAFVAAHPTARVQVGHEVE